MTWQHVLAPLWFFFLPRLSLTHFTHTNSFSPPNSQEAKLHQDQLVETKLSGNPLTDMAHEQRQQTQTVELAPQQTCYKKTNYLKTFKHVIKVADIVENDKIPNRAAF